MTSPLLKSITEGDVERDADEVFMLRGALAFRAVERRKRCPVCKTFSTTGNGMSRGIPDRLFRLSSFPKGVLVGVELKRPMGWKWSSREQEDAYERGAFLLAQGVEDVDRIIREARELFEGLKGVVR